MKTNVRKALIFTVKLAVTIGVLVWAVSKVQWYDYAVTPDGQKLRVLEARPERLRVATPDGEAWRPLSDFQPVEGEVVRPGIAGVMRQIRPAWVLLAAVFIAGQLTLMGVRWWWLLRYKAIPVGLGETIRLMYAGHFLNFFLPGTTGGDVIRGYLVIKRTHQRTVALVTVLLDRFMGLAGMALLAGVMTLLTWGSGPARRAALAVGVIIAIIAGASLVMFSRTVARLLHLEGIIKRLPRSENFQRVIDTLHDLPRSPKTVATVGVLTILTHLLLPAGIACLGHALGLDVPVYLYFLYVPVIYILAAVPISLGGLGVAEGMYIVFFAQAAGAMNSAALALALLARLTPMVLSLPGLVFWLAEKRSAEAPKAREAAAAPKTNA